ncbi:MAG: redoxin domain-containing protein [Natrialbaceae archaeon]|nr:redoxin domain-containing protein [Natrialbaceae archaeon]
MIPAVDDTAPPFEGLLCDGETFRAATLSAIAGERGTVLIFDAFVFSAIAKNWWRRYDHAGWADLDGISVVGIVRDGPYSINAFLRELESPFSILADLNGDIAESYGLLTEREGMAGIETPRRAVLVCDGQLRIAHTWESEDWISPVPRSDIEEAIDAL